MWQLESWRSARLIRYRRRIPVNPQRLKQYAQRKDDARVQWDREETGPHFVYCYEYLTILAACARLRSPRLTVLGPSSQHPMRDDSCGQTISARALKGPAAIIIGVTCRNQPAMRVANASAGRSNERSVIHRHFVMPAAPPLRNADSSSPIPMSTAENWAVTGRSVAPIERHSAESWPRHRFAPARMM